MKPFVADSDFTLYVGDVRECLRSLPDASVHCVVTSPPYWGLRMYLEDGHPDKQHELGLEPTPDDFVAAMVDVFREVRRVLRSDGTLWLNLGDSTHKKQLQMVPARVALALQADGWYLRSDIIWSKPNPMPESVTDRPTKAHEYVFLLTKSSRYFFDQEAVREPASPSTVRIHSSPNVQARTAADWKVDASRGDTDSTTLVNGPSRDLSGRNVRSVWEFEQPTLDSETEEAGPSPASTSSPATNAETSGTSKTAPDETTDSSSAPSALRGDRGQGLNSARNDKGRGGFYGDAGPHVRSVWHIATQPYAQAHFATFPEALPERCIKAGCPQWVCADCGRPLTAVETDPVSALRRAGSTASACAPTCSGRRVPGLVLDPFCGSGTTALVARRLGRRSIGVELNPEYAALCARRLQQLSLLAEV